MPIIYGNEGSSALDVAGMRLLEWMAFDDVAGNVYQALSVDSCGADAEVPAPREQRTNGASARPTDGDPWHYGRALHKCLVCGLEHVLIEICEVD
jgi:hypothetical protein